MKTRKDDEEKSKTKLSLQKKKTGVKKELKNILPISHSLLNETSEFRQSSSIKEQKVTVCQGVVSEAENKTVDPETESWKKCPTCELSMPRETFQHHVTDCLKNRFQKKETSEDLVPQEKFSCQFCLKDLSHYNSARKTQHLNRCMDQVDELKQKELQKTEELEQARTAVLDCPMCGRTLKSEHGRKVHMKKCSQNLGVSTDQLLDLIKKQEEERQINIAAGVVPQSVRAGISKLNKQAKKQKPREPHSKYDEELQTALALSNSLHNAESSKKMEIQPPKQGKRKKTDTAPPLVVLLSEEDKQKRRSERVAAMLIPQEPEEDEDDVECLTPVLSESQVKEKYSAVNNQLPSLWTRCELATERMTCLESKDKFYVERLMPPIAVSHFVVGSNIKKMDDIPGRRKSSYRGVINKQEVDLGNTSVHGDTLLASTQTAVVLAELEVSAMATPDLDLTCSGFCPDSPIKVQEGTKQKVSEKHQKIMVSLVNNPVFSDLRIKTSDGTIHAHRLILSVRCPNVLQNSNGELDLTGFTTDTVLAVMKFLYAGVICLPKGSVQEIKDLATRLEVTDLVEICSSLINKKNDEEMEEKSKEQEERNFTDLIEDDREVDPEENEGCSSENNNEWGELSDEEYNDIKCTQRMKYSLSDVKEKDEDSDREGLVVDQREQESEVSEGEISLFFHDDSFDETSVDPSEDNGGLEEKPEIQEILSVKGFHEDGITDEDHSVRNGNLIEGGEEIQRKDPMEVIAVEEMDIDEKQEEGNEKLEEESNEEELVREKDGDSILYQDEDLIIYSETEDTPPCSESDKFRQSLLVDQQSEVLDRSGHASSPVVVDSDSSPDGSPEKDIDTEENDGEVGSPIPPALDSSGLDLFESPVLSQPAREAADMKAGSQTSTVQGPAPSEEIISPDTPARKQTRSKTPVRGSIGSGSKRIIKYSNLENNRCDSRNKNIDDHPKCSSKRNKDISPQKSVTFTNIQSDDEVSVIEDKCQVISTEQTVVSPVFCQQQANERKTFRFTKTKPVKVNLERVLTPVSSERPAVISCQVDLSPPAASPGQHHQQEAEYVPVVIENDMELGEPEQDVWEDFDDSGMGECIVTCDVPNPSPSANRNEGKCATPIKSANPIAESDTPTKSSSGLKKKSLPHRPEDQVMEESFEDDSFDVEMVEEGTETMNSFKTPVENRPPKRSKKDWVPPSPFTPMPNYDSMATPHLKREVQKIGVKPVGKKRMVLLLKDIYHQTHQYETDSEFEISVDETTEQRKQGEPVSVSDEEEEISSSQDSERSVVLEERMIEEEETTLSQTGSGVSELTQKISQFILDTPELYSRILMYEPLEFDALKREITEAGIKCSMDKLLNYLDEKCITFTMKNRRKTSPKKGRGRGRKKRTEAE